MCFLIFRGDNQEILLKIFNYFQIKTDSFKLHNFYKKVTKGQGDETNLPT